jgi:hypothetical protein
VARSSLRPLGHDRTLPPASGTAMQTSSLGANYGIVVARQIKSLQIGPRTQSCTGESTTARSADPTVGGQTAAKSRGAVELQPTALRPA